ncbi:MAG TPA: cytochrome c-type biogenesis protein CcmH [Hyphomicrobium sp.]|nr:cytochrome c-type biogenesis protein CcmH [Hyphomicrobium sp.]
MTGRLIVLIIALVFCPAAVLADAAQLRQEDPIEPRVKSIAVQLRCPVCQGETIYDSHSTVATQMKSLIREKIAEGKSDGDILAFFVDRYGEFVLMEPRKSGRLLVIWLFPAMALLIGATLAIVMLKRRQIRPQPASAAGMETEEFIRRIEQLKP